MNTATKGIYSDFTPIKVAKKVTSELVGKKKQIIFHLREKGKSGKIYGYIGNIRDGKVVVRIHKMSGGEMGCVFNRIMPNNFKVDKKDYNNPREIEITNFCVTRATIIFFCTENYNFLEKDGNKYYTYSIYREGEKVFVKKLMFDEKRELITTLLGEGNNGIKEIALGNIHERKRILGKIKSEIETKRIKLKKENFAQKIYEEIINELNKQSQQPESSINSSNKIAETPPIHKLPPMVYKSLNGQKPLLRSALLPNGLLNPKNNSDNELINPYICPINPTDPSISEVSKNLFSQIFFGFDIDLIKIIPPTFYYKYSYRYIKSQKSQMIFTFLLKGMHQTLDT